MPRLALFAVVVCVLALAAAVVSFSSDAGSGWLGVVWIMMAGVSSNMAWFYYRKAGAGRS